MSYRTCLTVIFLSLIFFACNKTDPANPGSYRLKGFERVSAGDSLGYTFSTYTFFTYNSQNLIVGLVDSNSRNYGLTTSIEYNSQNMPVKFNWLPLSSTLGQIDTVIYNSNQQFIQRIKGNSYYSPYFMTNQYSYDQKGRFNADSTYQYEYINNDNVLTLSGYTKFNYDISNNITQTIQFRRTGGVTIEIARTEFTYDKNINPFSSIGWLAYFNRSSGYVNMFEGYYFPSKNNVLTMKYKNINFPQYDYTQTFTYKYENNRVKKILVRRNSGNSDLIYPINFVYE